MSDEYLSIKIDVGLLLKKIEEWKIKQSKEQQPTIDTDVVFSVGLNEQRNNDAQPLYSGKNIAVWHNVADKRS